MEIAIAAADVDLSEATLIVGVMDGLEPVNGSQDAFETADQAQLTAAGFEGKSGQSIRLPHESAAALLVVGLGDEVTFESLRAACGSAVRKVKTERAVSLLASVDLEGATRAVVEGTLLGGYEYRTYKTEGDPLDVQLIEVVEPDEDALSAAVIASEATNLARDLINTPARDKSPDTLATLMADAASEIGISVDIWDRPRIEDENLGALLGVAAGSDRDPRLVTMTYRPDEPKAHLALVGKGIVFDTGGLSIKPAAGMEEMKDGHVGCCHCRRRDNCNCSPGATDQCHHNHTPHR